MSALAITGIGELLTMVPTDGDRLGRIHHATLILDGERVVFAGPEAAAPSLPVDRIAAHGALVTPGLVEPHAHPIFAGSRAAEFDLRAIGKRYGEIQEAGGGILATVRATRAATDEQLIAATLARFDRFIAHGVTVCEAKTGYALDVQGELRLLALLLAADRRHPIEVSPTLLAHVPPPECAAGSARTEYVQRFAAEAIPRAALSGAEAFDVYCDEGAFTVDEARHLLCAARAAKLALRVHAEQFTHTGAADLAVELGARSVEHLEELSSESVVALAAAGTVCNLLPGAVLTLKLKWPDARRLLDAGCTVALGTDLNPGSSLTESLPLMMSLACMQMGMSVAEAWLGVTVAAAKSVGRPDAGRLAMGARGDAVMWDAEDYREVPQHFGVNLVRTVVIKGQRIERSGGARP